MRRRFERVMQGNGSTDRRRLAETSSSSFLLLRSPVYNFLGSAVSDSLYFADAMGGTYAVKLEDGKEVWRHAAPANARMSTGGLTGGSYGILYVTHNLKGCLGA